MAGQVEQDDDEVIAAINMVPFIDISLVLLIIFMVTSSYIVKAAIEVDLPTAATGSDAAPSTIGLVVLADGKVQLNGAEVTLEQLPALVKAEVAKDAKVQAMIAGDRTADYGKIIDVVDVVKAAGVKAFALNIEREVTP
jgi:biopolymer transport protein ExbD